MSHKPGDRVLEIGTCHLSIENKALVVEVSYGTYASDESVDLKTQNVTLPLTKDLERIHQELTEATLAFLSESKTSDVANLRGRTMYRRSLPKTDNEADDKTK